MMRYYGVPGVTAITAAGEGYAAAGGGCRARIPGCEAAAEEAGGGGGTAELGTAATAEGGGPSTPVPAPVGAAVFRAVLCGKLMAGPGSGADPHGSAVWGTREPLSVWGMRGDTGNFPHSETGASNMALCPPPAVRQDGQSVISGSVRLRS
ncbi:hypothetical protein GDO81_028453 [Engystomops pustulosus]|uniref:Uncharacterized protein n=1 Tax=Engystomops pustulosus TaxID=76066 RepID=A0AAV6YD63_ENGPU|nr:hypothetical protein GDO81_028453 [Engystomops pustulosus]